MWLHLLPSQMTLNMAKEMYIFFKIYSFWTKYFGHTEKNYGKFDIFYRTFTAFLPEFR